MQRIRIHSFKLFGHHGVYPEERERGQVFVVDVRVEIERRSDRDELASTVDYTAILEAMRQLNETQRFQLIESLAQALANDLIERFPRIQRARVRVRKRLPATRGDVKWVAAEVVRERSSASG